LRWGFLRYNSLKRYIQYILGMLFFTLFIHRSGTLLAVTASLSLAIGQMPHFRDFNFLLCLDYLNAAFIGFVNLEAKRTP
jgi:hypothetical protein